MMELIYMQQSGQWLFLARSHPVLKGVPFHLFIVYIHV